MDDDFLIVSLLVTFLLLPSLINLLFENDVILKIQKNLSSHLLGIAKVKY